MLNWIWIWIRSIKSNKIPQYNETKRVDSHQIWQNLNHKIHDKFSTFQFFTEKRIFTKEKLRKGKVEDWERKHRPWDAKENVERLIAVIELKCRVEAIIERKYKERERDVRVWKRKKKEKRDQRFHFFFFLFFFFVKKIKIKIKY